MKTKLFALVLMLLVSVSSFATETDPVEKRTQRVVQLLDRVQEIREMNFGEMEKEEKKLVKEELRIIKAELKAEKARGGLDDKVSISLGAIIIIILLLIIL